MKKEKNMKNPAGRAWLRRSVLAALLLTAGALVLWEEVLVPREGQTPEPTPTVTAQPAPAMDERSLREAAYEKDMLALQQLLENVSADDATRQQAAKRLEQMVAEHQSELGIEDALKKSGFDPCLVLMQNGALSVMVEGEALTPEASAAILSLCAAHTDIGAENIRIMTAQP